jgi:hypothetical protein
LFEGCIEVAADDNVLAPGPHHGEDLAAHIFVLVCLTLLPGQIVVGAESRLNGWCGHCGFIGFG